MDRAVLSTAAATWHRGHGPLLRTPRPGPGAGPDGAGQPAHSAGPPTAARTDTRPRLLPHRPGEDRTREKRCPPDRSRRPPPPRSEPAARPGRRRRSATAPPRYLHAQEESRPGRDRRAKPARGHREQAAPHANERCRRALCGSSSAQRRPPSWQPARLAQGRWQRHRSVRSRSTTAETTATWARPQPLPLLRDRTRPVCPPAPPTAPGLERARDRQPWTHPDASAARARPVSSRTDSPYRRTWPSRDPLRIRHVA